MKIAAAAALMGMTMFATAAMAQDLPNLEGKEVVVVTENAYPPLQFLDKSGAAVGWEYDAMAEIAKRINITVKYENTSWDAMIPAVSEGQFDIGMTGITIKDERKEKVDFSDPYMRSEMLMIVRGDEARFSDDIKVISKVSRRSSWLPRRTREYTPFISGLLAMVMVNCSSIGSFASSTTMAVISLVTEAIGTTRSAWLAYSSLLLLRSISSALPEARCSLAGSRCTWAGGCAAAVDGRVAVPVSNSSRLRMDRDVFTLRLTKSWYVVGCARVFPKNRCILEYG